MCIPKTVAETALQDFTAAADVWRILMKFHHTINDTYEVSCEMERRRVECAIMIKAALADQERMADHEEE